jgi:hypothetical protein
MIWYIRRDVRQNALLVFCSTSARGNLVRLNGRCTILVFLALSHTNDFFLVWRCNLRG